MRPPILSRLIMTERIEPVALELRGRLQDANASSDREGVIFGLDLL